MKSLLCTRARQVRNKTLVMHKSMNTHPWLYLSSPLLFQEEKEEQETRSCLGFHFIRAKQPIITPDEYPWRRARESQIIL